MFLQILCFVKGISQSFCNLTFSVQTMDKIIHRIACTETLSIRDNFKTMHIEQKAKCGKQVKITLMMRWTYCMMLHLNTKCPLQNFNLFMYPARAVDSGAVQRVSFLHLGGHFKKKSNFSVTPNAIVTWMGSQKFRDNNYVFENICICVDKA